MALHDSLCKTYNRQYSHQLLTDIFDQALENNTPLSILMMDIDKFKSVNDQYGHSAGDLILTEVAAVTKREIRESDIFGRYGGDEFIIGLCYTSIDAALHIAQRIRTAIENTEMVVSNTETIKVSVSIGASCLRNESTLDELIDNADKKLYEAKAEGRNNVKG